MENLIVKVQDLVLSKRYEEYWALGASKLIIGMYYYSIIQYNVHLYNFSTIDQHNVFSQAPVMSADSPFPIATWLTWGYGAAPPHTSWSF